MSEPTKAVFLSYASQDAEAAQRICEALRAAGLEVWFDRNELVGGDAWDQKIRRQIKECALFVPLITPNTNARAEGYFRLEWKLAVDRSHLMADDQPFLFPIVVGDVNDATARVPDRFREVQWTRLRMDETPAELAARVTKLLSGDSLEAGRPRPAGRGEGAPAPDKRRKRDRPAWLRHTWSVVGLIIVFKFVIYPMFRSRDEGIAETTEEAAAVPKPAEPITPKSPAGSAEAPKSEARRLAERGFELSVDNFDSTQDDFAVADDLLKRALALDPEDGEIWAYAAQLNFMFRNRGFDFSPERIATGRQQAERAIRLAPTSPEAVHAVALAHRYTNNTTAAYVEALRRVVQIKPDHARALMSLGSELTRQKATLEEGLAFLARARENPKWAPLVDYFAFLRTFTQRQFVTAEEAIRRSQDAKPSANSAAAIAVLHLTWKGDLEVAARQLAELPPALLTAPRVVWATAELHLVRRDPERALRVLDRLPDDFLSSSWYTGAKAYLVGRAHALAGREVAARIDWEKALVVIEQKLKAEPGDPALHRNRGEVLACLGRVEEALAEAHTVAEINRGQTASWNISEVTIYAALGRADLALSLLERQLHRDANWPLTVKLLQLDPRWDKLRGDPGFQKLLVETEAKEVASRPVRDWPKNPELKKAVALLDRFDCIPEDLRLAEEIAQRALDQAPTDPETVTAMARVQAMWLNRGWDRSSDRYLKTQKIAERAVQLAPDEPEALGALANYLTQRGNNTARARQLLERAIELAPNEPRFHRWRNELIWGDRSVPNEVALAAVERTLAQFPHDALVHYDASRHYRIRGRLDDSLREIDATLAIAPVANALVWKARILFGFHNDLAAMKAALDLVPERVRSIERTVFGYFVYAVMSGDYAVGVKALNDMPDRWMIDFDYRGPKALLLASLLEQQHKPALARIQYEIALKELKERQVSEPEDAWLKLDEAWVLHGLGRGEEARAALEVYNESIERPYRLARVGSWWFYPIAANLILGERANALALIREAAEVKDGRETVRRFLAADPRLTAFRDDPEIKALLAEK